MMDVGSDAIKWKWLTTGFFFTFKAYRHLFNAQGSRVPWNGQKIWKIGIP